jgi:nitrate reductase cytochrome c-type subunit
MDRSRKNKSPMSKTHYAGNDPEGDVAGARFTCTQCHVPLSNASPLVDSTFR